MKETLKQTPFKYSINFCKIIDNKKKNIILKSAISCHNLTDGTILMAIDSKVILLKEFGFGKRKLRQQYLRRFSLSCQWKWLSTFVTCRAPLLFPRWHLKRLKRNWNTKTDNLLALEKIAVSRAKIDCPGLQFRSSIVYGSMAVFVKCYTGQTDKIQ